MSNAAAGVFISYRRQEANWLAAWLHDQLVAHFGKPGSFLTSTGSSPAWTSCR
jgi:hypothetical protein